MCSLYIAYPSLVNIFSYEGICIQVKALEPEREGLIVSVFLFPTNNPPPPPPYPKLLNTHLKYRETRYYRSYVEMIHSSIMLSLATPISLSRLKQSNPDPFQQLLHQTRVIARPVL